MAKVKEQSVSYGTRRKRRTAATTSGVQLTATQLRKLPPRERKQVLSLQAKHAAAMFAAGKEEFIYSSSDDIEY